MGKATNGRIAIVTVHGTGDTATGPDGDKWFQNGSAFAKRLLARLTAKNVEADIVPHLWSGANSATDREKGARSLTRLVRKLARTHGGVHIVGHSHGGNVANDAASMLNWSGKQRKPKIASVTTVGAPFFKTQVTRGERFAAWAFIVIVVLSVFVAFGNLNNANRRRATSVEQLMRTETQLKHQLREVERNEDAKKERASGPGAQKSLASQYRDELERLHRAADQSLVIDSRRTQLTMYFTWGSILALIFVLPVALRGVRRIARLARRPERDKSVLALWHPNDEAIAFLQRVEHLPVEPFPRWSLLRGSRTGGISLGVAAVFLVPLSGLVMLAACKIIMPTYDVIANPDYAHIGAVDPWSASSEMSTTQPVELLGLLLPPFAEIVEFGRNALLLGFAGAPLVFAAVYLGYRLTVALVGEIGLRGGLNGAVGGALKGIAFGRDGDNRIGEVAPTSHYFATQQVVLDGDIAGRMLEASQVATRALFNKYRSSLFSVGADSPNAVAELAKDAMTWDSLIHTTYFDQPEIADMIGDRIADAALGR